MRTFIIGVSLALALTQVGLAEGKDLSSANAIMPGCRSFLKEEPSPSRMMMWYLVGECVGTIRGLVAAADLQQPNSFCVPDDAPNEQMVRVVISYIDRHPEMMHRPFSDLAYEALLKAWPCKP